MSFALAMKQRAAGAALPSRMPLRVGHPRSRLVALAAYVLVAVAGCGSDADDEPTVEGPLPIGADQPQAYTERFLSRNPRAELQPEHLAIVRLEPTGAGKDDTCAERDGVDCLPYFIDEEMVVTLAIDESTSEIGHLALRDMSGSAVFSLSAGGEPVTAVIAPGDYRSGRGWMPASASLQSTHASKPSPSLSARHSMVPPQWSGTLPHATSLISDRSGAGLG